MEPGVLTRAVADGAVARAEEYPDPSSLAAATGMRREFPVDIATVALDQAALRRRAVGKFGPGAQDMFFTARGLEQATRPEVARRRAERLLARGVRRVVDLGCGIGTDARAMRDAGLEVVAVEADPLTAEVARLNLVGVDVHRGDAADLAPTLLDDDTTAYCDPARRSNRGRSWQVADLSPSWEFVTTLLAGAAEIKLGPGFPHKLVPDDVAACWTSHRGQCVELTLSSGVGVRPGTRRVEQVTDDGHDELMVVTAPERCLERLPVAGDVLAEPDPAVLAAHGTDGLAAALGLRRISPGIGYLIGVEATTHPFLTWFTIDEVLPWRKKDLRSWLRGAEVGSLEIKKRGVDLDPQQLRRTLLGKGFGSQSATWIVTATAAGARVLVARRTDEP